MPRRRVRRIHPRSVVKLDALGLHRRRREAVRLLQDRVEDLRHLVGLLDSLANETFPHDEPDDLRGASAMMRAAVVGVIESAVDIGMALGKVRFMAALDHVSLDFLDDDAVQDDDEPADDDAGPPR